MEGNVSKPATTHGRKWVLLAAGSREWENYADQANVCHIYQLMHRNGIPDEQIVVMMYDDIANNPLNNNPGKIFNAKGGPDVYKKVPKDYTGNDVSAKNFLSVLCGDSAAVRQTSGTRKVIQSGENDTVFIYLIDHGGFGIFKFPSSTLYACDLIETVTIMSAERKFAKMVIFLEACHSGSMLNTLKEKNVYGVAGCRSNERCYSCFYDSHLKTWLSNVFTAYWLRHTENVNLKKTSFGDQFSYLQKKVSEDMRRKGLSQTPCNYGDMSILQSKLSEFLGELRVLGDEDETSTPSDLQLSNVAEATEIPLLILENSITKEKDGKKKESLQKQYDDFKRKRTVMDEVMQMIVKYSDAPGALSEQREVTRMYELKVVAEHFKANLFNWEKEPLIVKPAHLQVLVNLCEHGLKTETINDIITRVSREVTF